ncbi:hypothetical protein BN1708_013667, partial [Verticillium longisporum]
MSSSPEFLRFTGHRAFAQRLILSTLTGRPIHISKIRSSSPTHPGLAPHEVSFLRLLEAVTNGSSLQISLVAESSSVGVIYSADLVAPPTGGVVPEDIGKQCAYQLLETIAQGGCVSRVSASIVLTLMAMGSEDVGRLRIGRDVVGTEEVVGLARDLRTFGASSWGLRDVNEDDTDDIIVSVKGSGVGNVGRKVA